ncbi:MAG: RagB/SusD family nutrient uptake outer membrane protein [Bacteroidales bacterium]
MKNSIKIILLFITIIIGSCTDLVEDPQGVMVSEGFFKTTSDVETAIFGAYGRMAMSSFWGGEVNTALMLLSDMVSTGQSGGPAHVYEINNFNVTSTNFFSSLMWKNAYEIIGITNTALYGLSLIDEDDDKKKLPLEAEARVVRAYIYFTFVQVFKDMPYLDQVVTDPSAVSTMSKTSEEDIYQNIITDLKFGVEHLPMKYSNNVRTRVTAGTAATILSSVYLIRGEWQKAYDYAKWVIDNASELDYSLVSDFQDLFNAEKQDGISEHIFAVDFLGQERYVENDDYLANQTGNFLTGGWSIDLPSMAVYNTWDSRDYRKKVSFSDTLIINGVVIPYTEFNVPRPIIAKYNRYVGNSYGGGRRSDNNYVIYRYAEVLLIAAEALNEINGPTEEVLSYINQVRERARRWPNKISDYPADVAAGLSKDEFRQVVMEERRIELAFEYKRWFDIKRRQIGDEVFKGENSLEPHPNFDGSKHYLLPIPQTELDINPNLAPQNPGY